MVRVLSGTAAGALGAFARCALLGAAVIASTLLFVVGVDAAGPGPTISRLIASDPDNGDAVFSNGDLLRIYFSAATDQPGAPVLDTAALDSLFSFGNSIGTAYEGEWVSADLLVVRVVDAGDATPAVGSLTVGIIGPILSADGTSSPGEGVSPVLAGNWGSGSQAGVRTAALTLDILPPSGFPALPTIVAQGANVFFEVEVRNRSAEPAAGIVCLDADPSELRIVALAGRFPSGDGSNRICVTTKVLASREVQMLTATTSAVAPECTRATANLVVRTLGGTPSSHSVSFAIASGGPRSVVGPPVVSENEAFGLSASAAGCYPDSVEATTVGYAWSCTAGSSSPCVNQNTSNPLVLPGTASVEVPAGALAGGQAYTFRVMISEPSRAPTEGNLVVTVNEAPSGGFCTVSSASSAPEDEVLLECAGWGDSESNYPLSYRFGVVREGKTIWLSGFLDSPVLAAKLPALATEVLATVEDSLGARAQYAMPVSVAAPTFSDALASLLSADLQRAENFAALGDSTGFVVSAHSLAGVLHIATDAVSTESERIAIRKRLAALFLSLARESERLAGTSGSFEAALHLLAEITRWPSELDPESVEISSAIAGTLLLDGRSAVSDKGGDGVDAATLSLIVAQNLLEAIGAKEDDPTLDPEALAKLRRARVASNGQMIEAVRALLKSGVTYPGDAPVAVAGPRAAFEFSRVFVPSVIDAGAPVQFAHSLGTASLPASLVDLLAKCPTNGAAQDAGGAIASCTPAIVDIDFAAFESNPYTYSAVDLATPVVSVMVSTPDGLESQAAGLAGPVTVTLPHSAGSGASPSNMRCVHFDRAEKVWSGDGCTMVSIDSSSIECACTRLSAFAAQSTAIAFQGIDQQKCFFKMQTMAGKVAKLHKKARNRCLKLAKKGKTTDSEECAQKALSSSLAKAAQKTIAAQFQHCVLLPDFAHSSAEAINSAAFSETAQIFAEVLGTNGQGQVRASTVNLTTANCLQKVAISLDKVSSYRRKMIAKRIKSGMKDGLIVTSADAQRRFVLPDGIVVPIESVDDQAIAAKVAKAESKVLKTLEKKCEGVDLTETFPGICGDATTATTFSGCVNEIVRCHSCREGRETLTMFADCDLIDNGLSDGSCQ